MRNSNMGKGAHIATNALAGALAGAAAVWVMDRADWLMYNNESASTRAKTKAARPGGLDPAHVAVQKAANLFGKKVKPTQPNKPGIALHYGLGIGPGALYSVLLDQTPVIGKSRGLLFGLGLFLMQDEAINSATGLSGHPRKYPWQAHARGLISHLIFGVTMDAGVRALKRLIASREATQQEHREQEEPQIETSAGYKAPQDTTGQHVEH